MSFGERYEKGKEYLDSLAKPIGSLGTLEEWAARLAAIQRTLNPSIDHVLCLIFASDHGVAASKEDNGEQCSSYPQSVTKSILHCFQKEVAAASVLSKANNVILRVVDVGVRNNHSSCSTVQTSSHKLPNGTNNFCNEPAMTIAQVKKCIDVGRSSLRRYKTETKANVVALGEVGIGNTTSSSALLASLTGENISNLCGPGATTSSMKDNESKMQSKIILVKKCIHLYGLNTEGDTETVIETLQKLGGAEIASLVGAMMEAASMNMAILIDGFIVTTAALVAVRIDPEICKYLFFATKSSEQGQDIAIRFIKNIALKHNYPPNSSPALQMDLRLGEGTGAIVAVPLLRSAVSLFDGMATLKEVISAE